MKTLIAIPCMDFCHTDFLRALLSLEKSGEMQYTFAQSSLIYDARNTLCSLAIDEGFDRVLWLDSDMTFPAETLFRLGEHLAAGKDMVSGLYFTRKPPIRPVIFEKLWTDQEHGFISGHADFFADYPDGEVFPIEACGFGCCMTSVDLLRRIRDQYGQPFSPVAGFGEDLSFCLRVRDSGTQIWCDSSVKCGHVGMAVYDENAYRALRGAQT